MIRRAAMQINFKVGRPQLYDERAQATKHELHDSRRNLVARSFQLTRQTARYSGLRRKEETDALQHMP